jgi:hypothetical protein
MDSKESHSTDKVERSLLSLEDLDHGVDQEGIHRGRMEHRPHVLSLHRVNVEMASSASSLIWIKRVTTVDIQMSSGVSWLLPLLSLEFRGQCEWATLVDSIPPGSLFLEQP